MEEMSSSVPVAAEGEGEVPLRKSVIAVKPACLLEPANANVPGSLLKTLLGFL